MLFPTTRELVVEFMTPAVWTCDDDARESVVSQLTGFHTHFSFGFSSLAVSSEERGNIFIFHPPRKTFCIRRAAIPESAWGAFRNLI